MLQEEIPCINKTFAYHKPSAEGLKRITNLRIRFSQVEDTVKLMCPDSRSRSIALTELETAAMWAIKSVVFNDKDSVIE